MAAWPLATKGPSKTPAEPEPFERRCLCGSPLHGERTGQATKIECEACGRLWFVLPRDVYPAANRAKKKRKPVDPAAAFKFSGAAVKQRVRAGTGEAGRRLMSSSRRAMTSLRDRVSSAIGCTHDRLDVATVGDRAGPPKS